jgi:protein disulfide-isomerase
MANSNAHDSCIWLKKYNKSNELEELLFKAYLTDGKNINDFVTLSDLGIKAGLEKMKLKRYYIQMLMEKLKKISKWRRM